MTVTRDSRMRMHREDVNQLVKVMADDERKNGAVVFEKTMEINSKHSFRQTIIYYIIQKKIKDDEKKFVLFPLCKDAETKSNEEELPFFKDVWEQFLLENEAILIDNEGIKQIYTLLTPLRECRGFGGLPTWISQAAHIVLAQLDLPEMHAQKHDSLPPNIKRNELVSLFFDYMPEFFSKHAEKKAYPDKVDEIKKRLQIKYDPEKDNHKYGQQKANTFFCGYYWHRYTCAFLEGKPEECAKIKFHYAEASFAQKENDFYVMDKIAYKKAFGVESDLDRECTVLGESCISTTNMTTEPINIGSTGANGFYRTKSRTLPTFSLEEDWEIPSSLTKSQYLPGAKFFDKGKTLKINNEKSKQEIKEEIAKTTITIVGSYSNK